jgi:hypothetical protein
MGVETMLETIPLGTRNLENCIGLVAQSRAMVHIADSQRGLSTGLNHNKGTNWRNSHRERLHFLANDKKKGFSDVLIPIGATGEAEFARLSTKGLGEYYMDVKLAGGSWQCDGGDGTCAEMEDEIDFGSKDGTERSNDFKYVFDVSETPLTVARVARGWY